MSGKRRGKVGIQAGRPEPPPFLQRMREQIVANEREEIRERGERMRKARPQRPDDSEDDPSVVKIGEDDLTEEEYKRMRLQLDNSYKSDSTNDKIIELDLDKVIESGSSHRAAEKSTKTERNKSCSHDKFHKKHGEFKVKTPTREDKKSSELKAQNSCKSLSYSSDEE